MNIAANVQHTLTMKSQSHTDEVYSSDYNTKLPARKKKESVLIKCNSCDDTIKGEARYVDHMISNHPNAAPFYCEVCKKSFSTFSSLKAHNLIHTGNLPHVCDLCGKGFRTISYLNTHLQSHKGHKKHQCTICGVAFRSKWNLRCHAPVHSGERQFLCTICGKAYSQRSTLNYHLKTHSGDEFKNNKCALCDRSFITVARLKEHESTHLSVKEHRCDTCGKGFSKKGNLIVHYRVHSGVRPFPCTVENCNRAFSSAKNLGCHVKTHTVPVYDILKCNLCGVIFDTRDMLQEHIETRHIQDVVYGEGICDLIIPAETFVCNNDVDEVVPNEIAL